jgi:hypothetical protein
LNPVSISKEKNMLPGNRYPSLLMKLVLIVMMSGACNSAPTSPPHITQVGKISVERSPINAGEVVNLVVSASGDNLQFKWTATAGTFLSAATAPSVQYKAPDTPGSAAITVEVTGAGGTVVQNITLQITQQTTITPTSAPPPTTSPTTVPTPTIAPTATTPPACATGNLLDSSNVTPVFVQGESDVTVTPVIGAQASKRLRVKFNNTANGSGVAF